MFDFLEYLSYALFETDFTQLKKFTKSVFKTCPREFLTKT